MSRRNSAGASTAAPITGVRNNNTTAATLAVTESALSAARTEALVLKRRLRQYATTLDAVSTRAREEVAIALASRNEARSNANRAIMEKDELASENQTLRTALEATRKNHNQIIAKHNVVKDRALRLDEEAKGLKTDVQRLQKQLANVESAKFANDEEVSKKAAELYRVDQQLQTTTEERDELKESNSTILADLAATKRELALVRHELNTRAPPEIPQNVRRDIAEGAADAVERRTLKMLKAIARHYLKFKVEFDEIEHVDKRGIEQREQVEARVFAFAEAANEVLQGGDEENLQTDQDVDDLNDVRDAQQILQEHLAFIKRMSAVTEPELGNVQSAVQNMDKDKKAEDESQRDVEKSSAAEVENVKSTDAQQAASAGQGKVEKSIVQEVEKSSADGDEVQSRGVPSAAEPATETKDESQDEEEVVIVEAEKVDQTGMVAQEVINVDVDGESEKAVTFDTPPSDVLTQPSVTPELGKDDDDGIGADQVGSETEKVAVTEKVTNEGAVEPPLEVAKTESIAPSTDDVMQKSIDLTEPAKLIEDKDDGELVESGDVTVQAVDDEEQQKTRSVPDVDAQPIEDTKSSDVVESRETPAIAVDGEEQEKSRSITIVDAQPTVSVKEIDKDGRDGSGAEEDREGAVDVKESQAIEKEKQVEPDTAVEVTESETATVTEEPKNFAVSRSVSEAVVPSKPDAAEEDDKESDESSKVAVVADTDSPSRSVPEVTPPSTESSEIMKSEELEGGEKSRVEVTTEQDAETTTDIRKSEVSGEEGRTGPTAAETEESARTVSEAEKLEPQEGEDASDPRALISDAEDGQTPKSDAEQSREIDSPTDTNVADADKIDIPPSSKVQADPSSPDAVVEVTRAISVQDIMKDSRKAEAEAKDEQVGSARPIEIETNDEKVVDSEAERVAKRERTRTDKELREMVIEARSVIFEVRDVIREVRSVVLDVRDKRGVGVASDKATIGGDSTGVTESENAPRNVMDLLDDLADEIDVAEVRVDNLAMDERVVPTSLRETLSTSVDETASYPTSGTESSEQPSRVEKLKGGVKNRPRGLGGAPPGTVMEDDDDDADADNDVSTTLDDANDGINVRAVPGPSEMRQGEPSSRRGSTRAANAEESADEEIDVSGPVKPPAMYAVHEDYVESDSISVDLSVSSHTDDDDDDDDYMFEGPQRPMWPGNGDGAAQFRGRPPEMFFGRMPPPRMRDPYR